MTVTIDFFQQPKIRESVSFNFEQKAMTFSYIDSEFELELDESVKDSMQDLLDLLRGGGYSFEELAIKSNMGQELVEQICREFDRFGVLTESDDRSIGIKSGIQHYREMRRFMLSYQAPHRGVFFDKIVKGEASQRLLIGYAIEYYHIVHLCHSVLAPALGIVETPKTRQLLIDFFASELNHDAMLIESLNSVDIDQKMLESSMPLPAIFSICASLSTYAKQHPLTFKLILVLFEEYDHRFNLELVKSCKSLGMPTEFYQPLLKHSVINDEEDHEDVSRSLMEDVPSVTEEEARISKRHIQSLMEMMALVESQILEYYGNENNHQVRIYE